MRVGTRSYYEALARRQLRPPAGFPMQIRGEVPALTRMLKNDFSTKVEEGTYRIGLGQAGGSVAHDELLRRSFRPQVEPVKVEAFEEFLRFTGESIRYSSRLGFVTGIPLIHAAKFADWVTKMACDSFEYRVVSDVQLGVVSSIMFPCVRGNPKMYEPGPELVRLVLKRELTSSPSSGSVGTLPWDQDGKNHEEIMRMPASKHYVVRVLYQHGRRQGMFTRRFYSRSDRSPNCGVRLIKRPKRNLI